MAAKELAVCPEGNERRAVREVLSANGMSESSLYTNGLGRAMTFLSRNTVPPCRAMVCRYITARVPGCFDPASVKPRAIGAATVVYMRRSLALSAVCDQLSRALRSNQLTEADSSSAISRGVRGSYFRSATKPSPNIRAEVPKTAASRPVSSS